MSCQSQFLRVCEGAQKDALLFLGQSQKRLVVLELAEQVRLLAELAHLHVRLGVVLEKQVLVLRVHLAEPLQLLVAHQQVLRGRLQELGPLAQEHLLVVGVVKYVRVLGPPALEAAVVRLRKAQRVGAHDRHDVLGRKAHPLHAGQDALLLGRVGEPVLGRGLVLSGVLAAHAEEHDGAAAVLDGAVAAQLDEVGVGE